MATDTTFDGKPTSGANPLINSLVAGGRWTDNDGGQTKLTYSYLPPVSGFGLDWEKTEQTTVAAALDLWASVANINFVKVDPGTADINIWVVNNTDMAVLGQPGGLGFSEVPGFNAGNDGFNVYFSREGDGWSATTGRLSGGYAFVTLVHELGHALGLAHPHDGYPNAPDASKFPGVVTAFDLGTNALNQGVNTIMTYNDGWVSQYPTYAAVAGNFNFGWQGGPMALDIAAIQTIYGSNAAFANGDNTYTLPGEDKAGTRYFSIWDTGGTDTISASASTTPTFINLNAATLSGATAGGAVSFGSGVHGGLTIANGVVIENAVGSTGSDSITGNAAANYLSGGAGADTLLGGTGNDILDGGAGGDTLNGGGDFDEVTYAAASTGVTVAMQGFSTVANDASGDTYVSVEVISGSQFADTLTGDASNNEFRGNGGEDLLIGNFGADRLIGGADNDILRGGAGGDVINGGDGIDTASYVDSTAVLIDLLNGSTWTGDAAGDSLISIERLEGSNAGNDNLSGDDLANFFSGLGGDDLLSGLGGKDSLLGGGGNDELIGGAGADVLDGGDGEDTIFYTFEGAVTVSLSAGIGVGGAEGDTFVAIENVTGSFGGNDIITGSDTRNTLVGLSGKDRLVGLDGDDVLVGGKGADRLVGGGGADRYHYDGRKHGGDNIKKFATDDYFTFTASAFGFSSASDYSAANFRISKEHKAKDGDDRFIYDKFVKELWFDADGSGSKAAVLIAKMDLSAGMAANDIVLI